MKAEGKTAMKNELPKHFSNKFELRLDKIPTKMTDRMSRMIFYTGVFLGAALIALGIYELIDGMRHTGPIFAKGLPEGYEPMINLTFFDITIILIGVGIIVSLFMNYLQFKRIYFDGKKVKVIARTLKENRVVCNENLKNYIGVRFRIEFAQFGFWSRNKYIIELLHKNPQKIVPLYISYREKNVRRIWEYYARTIGLPAVIMTDEGLVYRKVENLDKSVKELYQIGEIPCNFDINKKRPENVAVVFRPDKIVLKINKAIWDAYNIIAAGTILAAAALIKFIEHVAPNLNHTYGLIFNIIMATIMVLAVIILFRKDKIVIKKYKIVNVHKFFGFNKKNDEMAKHDIEAIVVNQNPATGRYFVSIISDEKAIIFGKKLPIEDLRWIKDFLTYEIIK